MPEFTTETGCTVKVYPADADTMLHFRVEDGHVARRFQKGVLLVQQAFVKLDPASRAALRAALAPEYDKQAFDTFRDEHPGWHERSPFTIAHTFWQAGEQNLQDRIDKILEQHKPTEVYDPQEGETITICGACQEITGGDKCLTERILRGEA